MADEQNKKTEFTPEDLRESKGDFDPATLSHADETKGESLSKGEPQPSTAELAEQQRRDEKDIDQAHRTREDRLVTTGRGHQTAGRLGGVK